MLGKVKGAPKSKTVWLGTVISILGYMQANLDKLGLSEQQAGFIFMGLGVGVIVLRAVTDKPLEAK